MFGLSPFSGAPFSDTGSITIAIGITGVSASGAVGNVDYAKAGQVGISGVVATGAVNTLIIPLTSAVAVGAAGTVGVGISIPLTGVSASGAVGTGSPFIFWNPIDTSQTPNWQVINTN